MTTGGHDVPNVSSHKKYIQHRVHIGMPVLDGESTDWVARLGERIVIMDGCWIADGRVNEYASIAIGGVSEIMHRAVFAEMHPDIDITDMHVHHTCERKGCINPSHLVALTPSEHQRLHGALRRERRNAA